jgi:D-3-phosphoglycerate dehydrogenase
MTKPRVLISDKMDPNAARIFAEQGCEVDVITGETPEQLKARIGAYDGLAIRSSTKVTADILETATNLKVIGRAGIGVDIVDIPAASARGVVVMNTPFGNSITTGRTCDSVDHGAGPGSYRRRTRKRRRASGRKTPSWASK